MPFVSTDDVVDRLVEILTERFEKRRKELTNGPNLPPPVKRWLSEENAFPLGADRGDFPKGVVSFDRRTSERREQDTGETAGFDLKVRVYFTQQDLSKEQMATAAHRYGDAVIWTVQREGLGKRPRDGTVIPGLFRYWPNDMQCGVFEELDLVGAEISVHAIVDSSYSASV